MTHYSAIRKTAVSSELAQSLGAHAAEAEVQLDFAYLALAKGDVAAAKLHMKDAQERCAIIRNYCYWEKQS